MASLFGLAIGAAILYFLAWVIGYLMVLAIPALIVGFFIKYWKEYTFVVLGTSIAVYIYKHI